MLDLRTSVWATHHSAKDVEKFAAWFRAASEALVHQLNAKDNRTFDSFWMGAKNALQGFEQTSHAHDVLGQSTFRFGDLKKETATVFIVIDSSRMATQKKFAGLVQWAAFTELKRHRNFHVPVYAMLDELSNAYVYGIEDLFTWGRGYGIKIHGVLQTLSAFEKTYGKTALETLWSLCEIKQLLPGQEEPDILERLEPRLGSRSLLVRQFQLDRDKALHGLGSRAELREQGVPLMTADEIIRSHKTILLVAGEKPMLTESPPYAAIEPFRRLVAPNPFHGNKPYLKPVVLRLKYPKKRSAAC